VRRAVGLVDYRWALPRISSVAIATQPVRRLQIRPIVHNQGASPTTTPSYIRARATVQACGRGQTHIHIYTQTRVTTIHFASCTTHAKCNNEQLDDTRYNAHLCHATLKSAQCRYRQEAGKLAHIFPALKLQTLLSLFTSTDYWLSIAVIFQIQSTLP